MKKYYPLAIIVVITLAVGIFTTHSDAKELVKDQVTIAAESWLYENTPEIQAARKAVADAQAKLDTWLAEKAKYEKDLSNHGFQYDYEQKTAVPFQ